MFTTIVAGGTSISKHNVPATWGAGAISSNILPANTDGWIEFSGRYDDHFVIGLSVHDIIDSDKFSHAFFIDYNNNRFRIHEGETATGYRGWQTGDVFRISRVGELVNYYRNETIIKTTTVDPALVLKAKAALQYPGQTTPYINSSFAGQMILQGTVTGMDGNSGSGSIALGVSGSVSPYTYTWSSDEHTASIGNKQRGAYTITVDDAIGSQKIRTYNVGYKVNWINPIGVSVSNGILSKTATGRTWDNAGAVSSNTLAANTNGWIEFSTYSRDDFAIGLAVSNTIAINAFSHAVAVDHQTNTFVLYSGAAGVGSGSWQTGDVFRISRKDDFVTYYKNDEIIISVNVNSALVLKVKACLKYQTKSTPVINASFWNSDGVVRTYYSIADGNWTTPSIWSLSENGPPSTIYPDDIDKVVIKGHEVAVNSSIKSAGITITSTNDQTQLKVDGSMAALTVKGNIVMNRENTTSAAEVLLVRNNATLDVTD